MNKFDVVAGRRYDKGGEQKTQWINVGDATQWDDGNISIRLNSVPVGQWWDGTLKLFAQRAKGESRGQAPRGNSAPRNDTGFDDDEIAF